MASSQRSALVHEYINFHTDTVTGVVDLEAFEPFDERCEAVGHVHHLAFYAIAGGFSGETGNVFETGARPVVDDEQGEAGCTQRVEPPDVDLGADKRKQKGQGIEINV